LSGLRSRSGVTSAAIAGQTNMLLASNTAWIEMLGLAMKVSPLRMRAASLRRRFSTAYLIWKVVSVGTATLLPVLELNGS
jgi:hypothetical protein